MNTLYLLADGTLVDDASGKTSKETIEQQYTKTVVDSLSDPKEEWYVVENKFTTTLPEDLARKKVQQDFYNEYKQYLNNAYSALTRESLSAMYSDPDTNATQKAAIKSIYQWIKSLEKYLRTTVLSMSTAAIDEITWDFSTFTATNPYAGMDGITLIATIESM